MNTLGIPTSGPYLCRNRGKSFISPTNGRTYQRKKDYYVLTMSSKANLTYYKKVGFSINRKQRKLEEYLIKRPAYGGLQLTLPSLFPILKSVLGY